MLNKLVVVALPVLAGGTSVWALTADKAGIKLG
jgi:hypothetical protein